MLNHKLLNHLYSFKIRVFHAILYIVTMETYPMLHYKVILPSSCHIHGNTLLLAFTWRNMSKHIENIILCHFGKIIFFFFFFFVLYREIPIRFIHWICKHRCCSHSAITFVCFKHSLVIPHIKSKEYHAHNKVLIRHIRVNLQKVIYNVFAFRINLFLSISPIDFIQVTLYNVEEPNNSIHFFNGFSIISNPSTTILATAT